MEGLSFSKHARRTFHDNPYILTISGDAESLAMEVEHAEDGRRWRSKFAARFIEEITQRTGNAKKFDIFVRMLLSALAQESDAVYLDVLTARDLEMLRRHANPQGPPTTSVAGQSDKRYLILTYRAEFDKVHYPLPLPLDERSEEETLRALVVRLRTELVEARQASVAGPSRDDDRILALQRQSLELSEALVASRRETELLRAELRSHSAASSTSDAIEASRLRAHITKLQADFKAAKEEWRQRETTLKREGDRLATDLRNERQKVDRLQAQVRKLEDERRVPASRLPSAPRGMSAERSRQPSRSPSMERSHPPSRPPSRPASGRHSRASSVASSRDRTPSPSSFLRGSGGRGNAPASGSREPRLPAPLRSGSPGRGREPPLAEDRRAPSPSANLSPYRQSTAVLPPPRRAPSPGQRSRERTPSPVRPASSAAAPRAMLTLRDRGLLSTGAGPAKPVSTRYGSRPSSASRAGGTGVGGSQGVDDSFAEHRPGSLFGLAANLGLGPGSLPAAGGAGSAAADAVDACDIDARLQALQTFLKQTKNMAC